MMTSDEDKLPTNRRIDESKAFIQKGFLFDSVGSKLSSYVPYSVKTC